MDDREAAALALHQYDAHDEHLHHRVSRHLLSPGGHLRAHVMVVAAGGPVAPELEAERRLLAMLPLDDAVAEGPHAVAHGIAAKAPGCKLPWLASSAEPSGGLQQMSRDCRLFVLSQQGGWGWWGVRGGSRCRSQ